MKAYLKNYRQSPRKVRLIADLIRGKMVLRALPSLELLGKRAAGPIQKLLESAVANAKNTDKSKAESLFIKEIRVDEGPTMKRIRPRARGSAFPIRKRTSHISIVLGEKEVKVTKTKETKEKEAATPKKEVATTKK